MVFRDEIKPIDTSGWFQEFDYCSYIDATKLNTSSVKRMDYMFQGVGCLASGEVKLIGIDRFITDQVESMRGMFNAVAMEAEGGFYLDLTNWKTRNVKSMQGLFDQTARDSDKFVIDGLASWDVSNVTDMSSMFEAAGKYASDFNIGNIESWNTGNVEDMEMMFMSAGQYASYSLNLSKWNVSKVRYYDDFNEYVESQITPPRWVRSLAATADLLPAPELPDDVTTGNVQTITSMPDVAALIADAELNAPENTALYGWLVDAGGGDQFILPHIF